MADVTFGVKVTPDVKEKIDRLIKESDFDTHKEWFQHLLAVYDLHQLKQQDATKKFTNDLESIEKYLTRVQETIVEMMKKSAEDTEYLKSEWNSKIEELNMQLKASNESRLSLEARLQEAEEAAEGHKKSLHNLQKQSGVMDELCSTLRKSLQEKELEIEALKREQSNWHSLNYLNTIQTLTQENTDLKQQCQIQKHQLDLLKLEYENKLNNERLKAEFARKEVELLLQSQKKTGRPKKDEPAIHAANSVQETVTGADNSLDNEQTLDQKYELPEDHDALREMLADSPPSEKNE